MLGCGHQPGPRVVGNAGRGPLFQGGDQCILRKIFRKADVANDAGQSGNQAGRFDAPNGIDRGMGVGRRHCFDDTMLWKQVQEELNRCQVSGVRCRVLGFEFRVRSSVLGLE